MIYHIDSLNTVATTDLKYLTIESTCIRILIYLGTNVPSSCSPSRLYPVDKKRANEFGVTYEEDGEEDKETKKSK